MYCNFYQPLTIMGGSTYTDRHFPRSPENLYPWSLSAPSYPCGLMYQHINHVAMNAVLCAVGVWLRTSTNRGTPAPGRRAEEICLSLGPSSKVSYNNSVLVGPLYQWPIVFQGWWCLWRSGTWWTWGKGDISTPLYSVTLTTCLLCLVPART